MALNAYLILTGLTLGKIKGSVIKKGREGMIEVYAFHHGVKSPRDAASGQASGKRRHGQLNITKQIDQSTPVLYQALTKNEKLKEFVLRFYSNSAGSKAATETNIYTITLTDAFIASINDEMLLNKVDGNDDMPVLEQVCFVYSKIEWKWEVGNIVANDDWLVP